MSATTRLMARCDHCGGRHEATPSHLGAHGEGQLYAVTCDQDWLTEYQTDLYLVPDLGTPDARGFYRDWGLA